MLKLSLWYLLAASARKDIKRPLIFFKRPLIFFLLLHFVNLFLHYLFVICSFMLQCFDVLEVLSLFVGLTTVSFITPIVTVVVAVTHQLLGDTNPCGTKKVVPPATHSCGPIRAKRWESDVTVLSHQYLYQKHPKQRCVFTHMAFL